MDQPSVLTFLQTNIYALLSLGCALCAITMGIVVYGKNPKSRINILFLALTVTICLWGIIEFLYRQAPTIERAEYWLSLGLPWAIVAVISLHFILAFTEANDWLSRPLTYVFLYAPAAFFIAFDLATDTFKGSPVHRYWGWHFEIVPGPFYHIANAWAICIGIIALTLTIRYHFRIEDPAKKKRTMYVVLAFILATPIIYATEILLPYLDISFPRLTMPAFAFVCALIGYGMWRHKLFSLSPGAATESILNTMSDALLLVGIDKKIKLANRAAMQMLEYDSPELLDHPVDIVFAPREESKEDLFAKGTGFRGLIKTVIKGDVEANFVSKSGRSIPVSISGSLIRDTDNDLLGIVCIARDITERKRSRESLNQSEERYKLLVENAPLGIISIDTEGTIVDANPKLLELLGSPSLEEMQQINMLTFQPLIDAGISDDIRQCLDSPCQLVSEHPYSTKWGKGLYMRYYLTTRSDSEGTIVGVQAIVEDITEARKTAQALQKAKDELELRVRERTAELSAANEKLKLEIKERMSTQSELAKEKEQLEVTLRSIADGVIAVDSQCRILLSNRVAESLTGFSREEASGEQLSSVFAVRFMEESDKECDIVRTAIERGTIIEPDEPAQLQSKDGTLRLVSQSAAPIRDKQGAVTGAVLVFSDVTEKHKLEQDLFRARKLESVGVLAGGIAHDFNNILTGIVTNLFVAKTNVDKKSEAYALITETEKAAFKASSLTNQLLAFSKQGAPIKIVASIKEIIEDSIGFFLSGSNVDYRLDMPEELWAVEIDRGQMDQVLQHVIRNADEAMPEGGTITITAENVKHEQKSIPALASGNYVKVVIKDEGRGIEQKDLDKIFDPYFSRKQEGAGLGLAAVYAIIQKHDGYINVSSTIGKGTTVELYLPACEQEEETAAQQKEEKKAKHAEGRGRVLLMDDEQIIRSAGEKVFKSLGYDVESCPDGAEALRMYKEAMKNGAPFDAAILDLTVPGGMGGKETMKKLLELDPSAKGLVSSGYSTDSVLSNYADYGFSGVITKPYNIVDLKDIVQSVIEGE